MKTGINITRCNIGSAEMHNTRDPKYIAAVNASPKKRYSIYEDQTPRNSSWVNPVYSRKTLPELLEELRDLYRAKVGQAPQEEDRVREITDKKTGLTRTVTTAGWSPIREGVCPILESTTVEDFRPFAEWLHSRGLTLIRVDLHHDEGHTDELTGERKYNRHAHLIIDWVDHATGKTVKLTKDDTREMQTRLADSLRMERGVSKEITGADHLSPDEQRAKAAAEKVLQLEAKAASLDSQIAETAKAVVGVQDAADKAIRECCHQLQHIGKNTVKNFDLLLKPGAVKPTQTEQQSRDRLDEESRRDLTQTKGSDLLHEEATLRNLIYQTALAVERIGRKLQELAKAVPFWKKHRLAHEAHLQARTEAAEEKAANSTAEAKNALKRAENALREAEQRERRAEQREREAEQVRLQSQGVIDEQLEQARANGVFYADARWEKWKETNYDPLEREVGSLRAKVEKYADSVRFIAHTLTRYHPDSVRQFEEFGLRDAVGRETWDEAKQQNHQPTHGHGLHR